MSDVCEMSILRTLCSDNDKIAKLRGRGKVRIATVKPGHKPVREYDSEAHIRNDFSRNAVNFTKHARTCEQYAHRLKLIAEARKQGMSDEKHKEKWLATNS